MTPHLGLRSIAYDRCEIRWIAARHDGGIRSRGQCRGRKAAGSANDDVKVGPISQQIEQQIEQHVRHVRQKNGSHSQNCRLSRSAPSDA